MIRSLVIILFLTLAGKALVAQNSVKGIVRDDIDKIPVVGATVTIYLQHDSTRRQLKNAVTDSKGAFELTELATGTFIIDISSIGYEKVSRQVVVDEPAKDMGTINLVKQGKELADVTVVSKAPPVVQKGDTSQFSASQYKVNPDASTEDLIKKMPGITVDKDGTVTAQGDR